MKWRKLVLVIVLIVWIIGIAACGKHEQVVALPSAGNSAMVVRIDNFALNGEPREIVIRRPPERVVAIWQNSIETLLALGQGDKIIIANGLPDKKYLKPEYQVEYEKIPRREVYCPGQETVLAAKPDFILGWFSTFSPKQLQTPTFWAARNANVYIADSSIPGNRRTPEDEYRYIVNLGKIFGVPERANILVDRMKEHISATVAATQGLMPPTVLVVEESGRQFRNYGSMTLAGSIVGLLNGRLLAAGNSIGREELLVLNPEVLFVVITENNYSSADRVLMRLRNDSALKNMAAIRNNRLYTLPLYTVYCSGVRTYDGIRLIADGMYPETAKESL